MAYDGLNIYIYMDANAELRKNPVSKHQIQLEYGDEQADARRDTAEPVSRDQILRCEQRGQGKLIFLVHSWPRVGMATLLGFAICDDHNT